MATDKSDTYLVEAAMQGDRAAFDELAHRYRDAMFGIAFSKLGDFEAARDAAQDALVRAYMDLPTLRDPEKFCNWLYSITLTTALGTIRRKRYTSSLDEPDAQEQPSKEPNPHESAERSEKVSQVREALMGLPEQDRLPLILHYVNGYSHNEIGNILGTSISSIKNRVYRARRRMREEMLVEVEKSLKDERSPDVKDIYVFIQWFGKACSCRCSHCLLDSGKKLSTVSFDRVKALGEKFLKWRNEQGFNDLTIDVETGYSCDSTEDTEVKLIGKETGTCSWWYLSANGMDFRSEDDLKRYFQKRKEMGIKRIGVTFYGMREFHDKWAGREGDWDYTLLIAKTAAELGLERQETIFLSKSGIDDMTPLVELLDTIPGEKNRIICPWDYRGRGKKLEEERILASQIKALPEHVRQYINQDPRRYKRYYLSEAEWISKINTGNYPQKDKRVYIISVWEDNIDWLETTDCDQILQNMRDEDEQLYRAIPSLPTLAQLYGQKSGKRIYWLRDLEWKWIDLYLKAHPKIDPAGRFNDLDCVILWH